ncbi:MAG: cobalamin-binding protein [Gammaproteobacteria bacterium]
MDGLVSGSGVADDLWRHKLMPGPIAVTRLLVFVCVRALLSRLFHASFMLALILLLAACGPAPTENAAKSDRREGARKDVALRLVALSPHITELVYAAGAGDRLVGVVEYSDYPPAALALPRIGDAFRLDFEALAFLQPDVVLVWRGGNPPGMIQRLQESNYRVIELRSASLQQIPAEIVLIGELAGTETVANATAAELTARLNRLRKGSAPASGTTVFWQISAEPFYTVTGDHVISEIIELCGGENIFADLPGLATTVSLEAVLAGQPEVIIASEVDAAGWRDLWRELPSLPAVRDSHLYAVNPDLVSRSGPRIVSGAEQVCAALDEASSITTKVAPAN